MGLKREVESYKRKISLLDRELETVRSISAADKRKTCRVERNYHENILKTKDLNEDKENSCLDFGKGVNVLSFTIE